MRRSIAFRSRKLISILVGLISSGFLLVVCASAHAGPNDVAIIIANKSYSKVRPVDFADRDGAAFKRIATTIFGVPNRLTRIVELQDASFGDLVGLFGFEGRGSPQLTRLVKERDTRIYVFYSGHGLTVRDESVPKHILLPVDSAPDRAMTTGFRREWLHKALRDIQRDKAPDGQVVLFLDACFSGSSDAGDLMPDTSLAGTDAARVVASAEDRLLVVAASSGAEVAYWDRPRRYGVFTHALLLGMFGAADKTINGGNGDDRVTARELEHYLKVRVGNRLARLNNVDGRQRSQTPGMLGDKTIVLASLSRSLPPADFELEVEERTQCRQFSVQPDLAGMSAFLNDCVTCTPQCRANLKSNIEILSNNTTNCVVERRQLDKLSCPIDRLRISDLANNAACPTVKAEAARLGAALECQPEIARDQTAADARIEKLKRDIAEAQLERALAEARRNAKEAEGNSPAVPSTAPLSVAPQVCRSPPGMPFQVTGVSSNDVLYMRARPDHRSQEIYAIPANGTKVYLGQCTAVGSSTWCEVVYDCRSGWVNRRYLKPERGNTSVGNSRVIGVRIGDHLWVRPSPGDLRTKLGGLAPGTTGIEKIECGRSGSAQWCRIRHGALTGWVNARYLD